MSKNILTRKQLLDLAAKGAKARVEEIGQQVVDLSNAALHLTEEAAKIRRTFPDAFVDEPAKKKHGPKKTKFRGKKIHDRKKGKKEAKRVGKKKGKKHHMQSTAARNAASERMKKYWAAKRKAE